MNGAHMAQRKPNILFFFTDQQRWDTCGCYGQPLDITPNLDRLASAGVRFANAYTCQPVCGPARACLQTGKYATEVNCPTNHRLLPLDEDTIAKQLRRNGYEVGYIGKWHLASCGPVEGDDDFRIRPVPPSRRGGFDDYWLASDTLEFTSHAYDGHMFDSEGNKREFPEGRYRVDAQTDWVLEYLETRDQQKPFYLFTSYIEPHHQNDHGCYEGPHGSKQRFAKYDVPGDLVGTEGDWRENYPDYLGCINSLDQNLGRVCDKLEELGLAENTIIIFTSDHGSHFCTRNGEYKRSCHDGCTHVPMIIHGPGFEGGQVRDELVSLIDLPATVLQSAGVTPPDWMQGHHLNGLVNGSTQAWPEEVFIQISESQCGRAIRTAQWTYSVRAPDAPGHAPDSDRYVEDFLYDNDADPHQKNNLVASPEHAGIRTELKQRLLNCMAQANERETLILPAGQ
jgi:arylsulfatase A-like enzyme